MNILKRATSSINRGEDIGDESLETDVKPWNHLVRRSHPWRKQLYVRGRNATVGQLMSTIRANQLSLEQAADDLDLPVEAIGEIIAYADQYGELIAAEAAEERRILREKGYALEPSDLPG